MKDSVELELDTFLADRNAYPIKNHLENLHRVSQISSLNFEFNYEDPRNQYKFSSERERKREREIERERER